MSVKHPIISVTGSSGAGTTTVKHTFDQIFRREGITAVSIEGDAFHRFDRATMKAENGGSTKRSTATCTTLAAANRNGSASSQRNHRRFFGVRPCSAVSMTSPREARAKLAEC